MCVRVWAPVGPLLIGKWLLLAVGQESVKELMTLRPPTL